MVAIRKLPGFQTLVVQNIHPTASLVRACHTRKVTTVRIMASASERTHSVHWGSQQPLESS